MIIHGNRGGTHDVFLRNDDESLDHQIDMQDVITLKDIIFQQVLSNRQLGSSMT